MATTFKVETNWRELEHKMLDFEKRQIPFALALTFTDGAKAIAAAATASLSTVFDTPTPFTRRTFGVVPAKKDTQTARVFAKDIQAAVYLSPYLDGGLQALGNKRKILTPIAVALNSYGNIPRNKIAALKGKSNVFVGPVRFKDGATIYGVWQRGAVPRGRRRGKLSHSMFAGKGNGGYGTKGKLNRVGGNLTTLTLLVEFTDPKAVTKPFGYQAIARVALAKALPTAWEKNLARAIATAK